MTLWAVCLAVEVAALVMAWYRLRARSRRHPADTENASGFRARGACLLWLLAFAPASDVVIQIGKVLVIDAAPRPFVGLARALYHVETALLLAWPAGLAAVAWTVFASAKTGADYSKVMHRRGIVGLSGERMIGGAWALAVVAVVLAHPLPRGWTAQMLRAWSVVAVAVGAAAVVRAWRSPATWGRSAPHAAVLVLLGTELAVAVVGPYVRDPYRDWDAARLLYVVGFGAVTIVMARRRG